MRLFRSLGCAGMRWCLALSCVVSGCQHKDHVKAWVDDNTAYLRCTTVRGPVRTVSNGPRAPRLAIPTGFYVGDMQGPALEMVGFAKDSVVCASLQAPSSGEMADAKTELLRLAERRQALRDELGQDCACEMLYLKGMRATEPRCAARDIDTACLEKVKKTPIMQASLDAVLQQFEQTRVPMRHWRMVGRAGGKRGWVRNHGRFLGALRGGSEVFLRNQEVTPGKNRALIDALLQAPGVVAVVRQRRGQALLVVRYLRDQALVLDYFEHSKSMAQELGVLHKLDNANIETYRKKLRAPEHPRVWGIKGTSQTGWGWSLEAMQRLDAGEEVRSYLGATPYEVSREVWRHPKALAQAGWVSRSEDEDAWTWTLELQDPVTPVENSGAQKSATRWAWPRFVPADQRSDFLLRGSAWGQGWIYAISSIPERAHHAATQRMGAWEAVDNGFVYRWQANELPPRILGSATAQSFFEALRSHGGAWSWTPHKKGSGATLKLRIEKGPAFMAQGAQ